MIKNIRKRDGRLEPWNPAKVNGWGQWAAENDSIGSVDWQSVVMRAVGKLPEECSSVELQDALIRECLEQETWGHQRMAGRLYASTTYKEIYPGGKIPTVKSLHRKLQDIGYMVDLGYTDEEYRVIEGFIKHDRDFRYPHYQLFQLRNKYALRNRLEKKEYESPQFVFMRMAMALAQDQPTERKLHDVKAWYNHFSLGRISPPTPNYVNLGTKLNSYASCCLTLASDSEGSLSALDHIAYRMTAASAGLGAMVNSRSIGDPVRGGIIRHSGRYLPL